MKGGRKERFLQWYCGETPPLPSPPEYQPYQPKTSGYHNRTVAERVSDWSRRRGDAAFRNLYNTVAVIACVTLISVLMVTVAFLPPFGHPDNPTNNEVPRRYIEQGIEETGAVNVVASMILDYRAFDTFGEANVLFTSACAVLILLAGSKPDEFDTLLHEMEEPRHDIILKKVTLLLMPIIIIFGFYVVVGGHISPGGGFSGGAIIGAALILYTSAYGTREAQRFFTLKTYRKIMSVSLTFYGLAKGYAFFTGANHLPIGVPLGQVGNLISGGLILPLNLAVGMVVSSTIYIFFILFSKGGYVLDDD